MAKTVLSTTLLIFISVASSSPLTSRTICRCPNSWVVFGNSCYKLITERTRWYDAQFICKTIDSSLVNIGSQDEDQFVVRLARNHGVTVWIGLSDLVQEGHFVWIDTQQEPRYTNWFHAQPDDSLGEDCGGLWYEGGSYWNDYDCENRFAAICEKPSF